MAIFVDARIPVVFATAAAAGPEDALLVEEDPPAAAVAARLPADRPDHGAACACCAPRGAWAEALSRLFLARARAEAPFFRRVVGAAGPEAEARSRAVLAGDAFLLGRYRLAG